MDANSQPKNTSITLVEARQKLVKTIGHSIREQGYQLSVAATSREALSTVSKADIVLIDLMLDDIDGLSLIEEIRASYRDKHIIAVMADCNAAAKLNMDADAITLMAAQSGANAVFIAPFNLGELLTTVNRFAELRASGSAIKAADAA